ncbi:MAG: hypothetical protein CMJ67_05545 [Planctomycetaceae bacterium]|nr:hypothetical protein [Planctomycetaceae bacterium]
MTVTHLLDCLGGTVMHALWQGIVIGILVLAALRSTPDLTARSRHAISILGLLAFFITGIVTFGSLLAAPSPFQPAGESNTEPAVFSSVSGATESPATMDPATTLSPSMADQTALPVDSVSTMAFEIAPFVGWTWVLGVGLLSLRLVRQWIVVQRLRLDHTAQPDDRWIDMFDALKRRLVLDSNIRMFVSRAVDSPMVVGWIRPVVLVPVSAFTSLTPDQLQTILAHELLHISRRDHVFNMLQGFMEIALFFHPVTWWLSRQIRIERENCCDDDALTIAGSPRSLAEALLILETLRSGHPNPKSILAATGGSLMHRVSRLFASNRQSLNVGWRALSACSLLTIAGLSFTAVAIDGSAQAQDRGTDTKATKGIDQDDTSSRNERRKRQAGIEERLQAFGRELREQVAAGEMTEEEAREKYEAMEERMRSRNRDAGDDRRNGRRDRRAEASGTEERLQAFGRELRQQVAAGEMTGEEAREKYEAMEKRMRSRSRDAEEKQMKDRKESEAGNRELEELKANVEERLRAMGMEIRKQVAAGEMTAEDGRAKFEAAEKRMWSRYREAEARTGQREKGDGARKSRTDLEELKANIEERLRAMGMDIRKQVADGEMTAEDGRAKFEAAEKRMWSRYREAEEQQMKGADAGPNEELERLRAEIEARVRAMGENLRKQVADGEISEADAKARYEEGEKRMWMRFRQAEERRMKGKRDDAGRGSDDLEELRAGIEERLRAMGMDIRKQVAAGEMTPEDGRAKFEAAEKRMWSRYRQAEMNREKGDEARKSGTDLEELKAGIEERLRAMGADLRKQVAAGELTEADAREKYEAMEKRMWSRYQAAEEKQAKEGSKTKRRRKMSQAEFDEAYQAVIDRAVAGEITELQAQLKMASLRTELAGNTDEAQRMARYQREYLLLMEELKAKRISEQELQLRLVELREMTRRDTAEARLSAQYEEAYLKLSKQFENGEITREQMQKRLERMTQMDD